MESHWSLEITLTVPLKVYLPAVVGQALLLSFPGEVCIFFFQEAAQPNPDRLIFVLYIV